jgi:hypothetical protein
MQKSPAHKTRWSNMLQRCRNPNNDKFRFYGGRGITVCEEWKVFKNFQAWCLRTYEPGKTLDRKDNTKGYSPSNCRWATKHEQTLNQRRTSKAYRERIKKFSAAGRAKRAKEYGDPATRKSKWCAMCVARRPLKFFGTNRAAKDGLTTYCHPCKMERQRAYRKK